MHLVSKTLEKNRAMITPNFRIVVTSDGGETGEEGKS